MKHKYLPLLGVIAFAGSAQAITFNVTDFTFGDADTVTVTGTDGSPSYSGQSGQFVGTVTDPNAAALRVAAAAAAAPGSFTFWCAELTQTFSFGVTYTYGETSGVSYFGSKIATDLSRLFTAAQGFVVDKATSAALQAGIWEVIYEKKSPYNFANGSLVTLANNPADAAAFAAVNGFLGHLGDYAAAYDVKVLTNPDNQDFVVATIPEPETWALLLGGLAALGWVQRRRKR